MVRINDCERLTFSDEEGMKEFSLERPKTIEDDNLPHSVFGVGGGFGRDSSLLCTDLMLVLPITFLLCLCEVSWC